MPKPDLDSAYALDGVEDARKLYAEWAGTYDETFARAMDFAAPLRVAEAYLAAGGQGPVLDFGCGTGLLGEELQGLGCGPVDGCDLSPQMLDMARGKGVYRNLTQGDIYEGLPIDAGRYAGVVSSGTFTHGHVGPDALPELLRVAAGEAQFALLINSEFYKTAGFQDAFDAMADGIERLDLPEIRVYGDAATGPHKDDTAMIALFRKV